MLGGGGMSLRAWLACVVCSVILWRPADSQYAGHTQFRLINKIKKLTHELVADAEVKIAAIQHYRDQYYRSIQYQLGQMVYDMRNKYKRMVFLYQRTDKEISYRNHDYNAFIPVMLEMFQLGLEVENSALMIIEWQKKREDKEMFHTRMKSVMRSGREPDHELDHEQLEKLVARVRQARGGAARGPGGAGRGPAGAALRALVDTDRARALAATTAKKKNKKWRHVNDHDFV